VQQAAVFRDGTGIVIYKDLDKTCASLARFSRQDAETFRALWHTYCRNAAAAGVAPLQCADAAPSSSSID
jgi:phytoene dehydrogenase-like protein